MYVDDSTSGSAWISTRDRSPRDELFDQLAHPARRHILLELLAIDADDELTCDDVAIERATRERDQIALYHTHLPKLTEAGYIEWDRGTDTIAPGPRFETIASVVELLTDAGNRLPPE